MGFAKLFFIKDSSMDKALDWKQSLAEPTNHSFGKYCNQLNN